jgi:methionyl-tRNA formyltransferase
MAKFRVVFLGTPEFAVESLKGMIADDHFDIVAVVTQPDRPAGRKMQLKASPVKELALAHGLTVFSPETVNTQEFRDQIAALKPESAAVVAFGQILGQKFLDLFPRGSVNVHGSVLPRWRGAAPIQRSIMEGDTEGGVSLQIVVKKLDAGPVLGLRRLAIAENMNAVELHDALKIQGAELLHQEYADYLRHMLTPVPQDESQVTIAPKIDKAEAHLDWTKPALSVHNRVRGLAMGPAAYALIDGKPVKIHRTSVASRDEASSEAGRVLAISQDGTPALRVACGEGSIWVHEVQPESRQRMSISDFLRGYPLKTGSVLS